jgi:gas vesicle protein
MPSRFTRRRLLGGLAGGCVAGVAGYQFLPATLLPASAVELRTARRSIPAVDTSLPVAPAALESSRDHLRAVIERAEAAWDEVEDSDIETDREEFDRSLESSLDVGRERLDETEEADPTTETLKTLRLGVNRAAWSLGAAKAISEDYDPDALRERSNALSDDVNEFANGIGYETADPRRGLAFLYRAERGVLFARMKADNAPDDGQEFTHRAVVETIRSEIEAQRWLGDASAIYDSHRSNVADADAEGTADLEAHLDRTWQDFADRIDRLVPDRETATERYFPDDGEDEEGPRERATNELFTNGYSAADDAHSPSFGRREGLLAYVAVEHAKALQHALGFQSAMDRLDEAFADGGIDMARVDSTKRQALSRLRDLLAESDDPLTRELAARPREEIAIGDWPFDRSRSRDSEHPRAEAYAMYLLAAENLGHTPEVRDALLP